MKLLNLFSCLVGSLFLMTVLVQAAEEGYELISCPTPLEMQPEYIKRLLKLDQWKFHPIKVKKTFLFNPKPKELFLPIGTTPHMRPLRQNVEPFGASFRLTCQYFMNEEKIISMGVFVNGFANCRTDSEGDYGMFKCFFLEKNKSKKQ